MKSSFSNDASFVNQLKLVELKINQQQLQEAAQQLNQLVKTSPRDPRLFLLGSRLAEAAGNTSGMLDAARKAYALAPQWPVAGMHLANVLGACGHANEAIAQAATALQNAFSQNTMDVELISNAAALAQRLRNFKQALIWLRGAEEISPADMIIQHQIALTLIDLKDFHAALPILTQLLQSLSNQPRLLLDRVLANIGIGDLQAAHADTTALLALDPGNELYQYYDTLACGKTPNSLPPAVITQLFDNYAPRFDKHLVQQLQYRIPKDVADMVNVWFPNRDGDILDLGCGTGLFGVCLGPIQGVLVGVDLSQGMIRQAAQHNVYDKFHLVDALDALKATPDNLYHVITALDMLNYVGDLSGVMPNAYRILLPGGRFVFTCEAGAEGDPDFALQKSQRYAHQLNYVKELLTNAGFEDVVIEERTLRLEHGQPAKGFLVVASKPVQTKSKVGNRKRSAKGTDAVS